MPLAPSWFPRYSHPQLFVDLKLMEQRAITSQLVLLVTGIYAFACQGSQGW